MDDNNGTDFNYFKNFIQGAEGNTGDVYDDQKGNPTVGTGFNLNSPIVKGVMSTKGINPDDVVKGNRSISSVENDDILKSVYDAKKQDFDHLKDNYFPGADLNPAQTASMMSLMYNNPHLIGPNMRDHLNNNNTIGVIKELMLNSNKDEDPGILKRRIKEAELYGGPIDFNMAVKTLKPDELDRMRDTIHKMDNENELAAVKQKYPFLQPVNEQKATPVTFYKAKQLFGD